MKYHWPQTEKDLVDNFHRLFYGKGQLKAHGDSDEITIEMEAHYCGHLVQKNPLDLWVFQEILWECKPDLVIEMGTASGGTTLYMADVMDRIGNGHILSIDIDNRLGVVPLHPRILYMVGDTLRPSIIDFIREEAKSYEKVMLILDDDHGTEHVLEELLQYSKLVTSGQYLIVEDTNVDHPLQYGDGPGKAVKQFMEDERSMGFRVDKKREKFLLTFNPGGYLKRL